MDPSRDCRRFPTDVSRFKGNGIYLLDEPEAALSPSRQMAFLAAMNDLLKRGSQFVIATHSPILMAYPGATIYQFTDASIAAVSYRNSEHYKVTKAFLTRTDQMLAELTGDIQSPTPDDRQNPGAPNRHR
jgi:predicted ATPase